VGERLREVGRGEEEYREKVESENVGKRREEKRRERESKTETNVEEKGTTTYVVIALRCT
jgi:hypothetical protein